MKIRSDNTDPKPVSLIKIKSINQRSFHLVDKFGEIIKGNQIYSGFISSELWPSRSSDSWVERMYHYKDGLDNYNDCFKKFDLFGNLIHMSYFKGHDELLHSYDYQYAEDRLVEVSYLFVPKPEKKYSIKNNYSAKGEILDETMFLSNESIWYKRIYSYNSDDNLVEEKNYNEEGLLRDRRIYEYLNGKIRTAIKFRANGDKEMIKKYEYNNESYILNKRTQYLYMNGPEELLDIIYYNNEGLMIEWFDSPSRSTKNYKYNEDGLLIEFKNSARSNDINKYSYEFDEFGNWIKKHHNRNDMPNSITIREIEYY